MKPAGGPASRGGGRSRMPLLEDLYEHVAAKAAGTTR